MRRGRGTTSFEKGGTPCASLTGAARARASHLLAALLCFVLAAEVSAQLPNAWQITDESTASGSTLRYFTNITSAQTTAATGGGWRYAVTSRLVTDYGGGGSMYMIFGDGKHRFGLAWDLNAGGQLTGALLGGPTVTLVTDPAAATEYHVHQLIYDPASGNATYEVDGRPVATWGGEATANQANTVQWGGASSSAQSEMNFHRAEFEIIGQGVIAAYSAGLAGNPALAPNPTTQGWARDAGATAIPEGPVSPDTLPVPLAVSTRAASGVASTAATLNAQVAFNGLATSYWFEYGTTANYGHFTGTNLLVADVLSQRVSSPVGGLELGSNYHFRVVAANITGVVSGEDVSFTTTPFETVAIPDLQGVYFAKVAWGDYDNDGRLDFLLTGTTNGLNTGAISQLWRNTQSGFTNVTDFAFPTGTLPGVTLGAAAWGDYDNDSHLDLLITGFGTGTDSISELWRNTGDGFTEVTGSLAPDLPAVSSGSVAWGDYDRDGRLDFLITGYNRFDSTSRYICQIWRNTGNGFTNVTDAVAPGLPGIQYGSVAWGDYDNDTWLDFLLVGNGVSQLWRNIGGRFTNVTQTVAPDLPGVHNSFAAWGDYDGDGRLDFFLTGSAADNISQLWRNTESGFTNVTATAFPTGSLPGIYDSALAWGDYDNDGLLDLLLTGYQYQGGDHYFTQLWRNTGSGFTNVTDAVFPTNSLPGLRYGSVAWGDYNNDGRLDFLLAGGYYDNQPYYFSQLWRNNTSGANTPPSAPTGLAMTTSAQGAVLSWNSAIDAETPSAALSYNVRAGTLPGGTDLLAAEVNAANGFRRVPALGNASLPHRLPLAGVTNGQTVYWSVQAVDAAFVGGPFAPETSAVSQPQLHLSLGSEPSTLDLWWTPPTWGWLLQETPDINSDPWTTAPSGEDNPASVPVTDGRRFYRLLNP